MDIISQITGLQGEELIKFIISQGLGIIMTVLGVISGQVTKFKQVLILQITLNLLLAASSLLMNGIGGALIGFIAMAVSVIIFVLRNKNIKLPVWFLLLSAAAFIAAGTYGALQENGKGWVEIMPIIGSLCFLGGVSASNMTHYRAFNVVNSIVWLIYDYSIMTYANMLTHGFLLISFTLGIIRLDILKKKDNKKETAR